MMSWRGLPKRLGWALLLTCVAGTTYGDRIQGMMRSARLGSSLSLSPARPMPALQDTFLICFQDSLSAIINPGCFETIEPGLMQPGDCRTRSQHYFIQYYRPNFPFKTRVTGLSFLSNDDLTVFPSAGVMVLPVQQGDVVDWPRPGQLDSLQAQNIDTPGDLSLVTVDLHAANIEIPAGNNFAVVAALQFPQGGELTAIGVGPGIAIDQDPPDQDCDFFTIDGGESGVWFFPTGPIDWGFAVFAEPVDAISAVSWTKLKTLYRTP